MTAVAQREVERPGLGDVAERRGRRVGVDVPDLLGRYTGDTLPTDGVPDGQLDLDGEATDDALGAAREALAIGRLAPALVAALDGPPVPARAPASEDAAVADAHARIYRTALARAGARDHD